MPYSGGLPLGCSLTLRASGIIAADLDRDHDVDQADFAVIQRCFAGPEQPADPACAD